MIKYSEIENSFTVDCDACGNFYPATTDKLDLTCDLYRFCSDRCRKFAFDRMKLITQTIKPTEVNKDG